MPEYKSNVYLLSNAIAITSTKDVVGDAALLTETISAASYQKVISYQSSSYIFKTSALLDDLVFLDSNAALNYSIREIVPIAGSYQKVRSYQSSSYIFRKVALLDDLVFLDSNAVLNYSIRRAIPCPSYQKVTSYPVYEYTFNAALYAPIAISSNAVLNYTSHGETPCPSYQKVISSPVYEYNLVSAPYTPIVIDSNASFNPGFVAEAEPFVISNGVATCTIVEGLHANLLVRSCSFFVISDTAPPPGEQSFTARQRSGASFSALNPKDISFSADQSSSSEMVYARYDEAFSFSCGQPTSASFAFLYTDYNTNLPSMYCGNPSFEVTNVLGGWKKVIGMDTLLKIEHGVSAKAMVKANSSCPEEAISIRFKIASEKSSPTGYFVLDDDGTWSPDNMSVTVFVDDPGWYKLEWYVKVGRGARMDWIKLSGATISHS